MPAERASAGSLHTAKSGAGHLEGQRETIVDNRPQSAIQRKLIGAVGNSPRITAQRAMHDSVDGGPRMAQQRKASCGMFGAAIQRQTTEAAQKPNRTGLPDRLKSGVEALSGMSMDHVNVHYNSPQPAQLNAHAYAQGSDIHVAPGQEKHLPHEAWHVVQQAQGRVRPTVQMKGNMLLNDDMALEREADLAGARALGVGQLAADEHIGTSGLSPSKGKGSAMPFQSETVSAPVSQRVVQRQITIDHIDYNPQTLQYRDGFIDQANFYLAVRAALLGSVQFGAVYTNHWNNVRDALPADFNAGDIDVMTTTVSQAIIAQYGGARPLIAGGRVAALELIVRAALIANIQPDHQVNMTPGEGNAYDQLAATAGATESRAKTTPNTVQYANLPGAVQNEVAARLTEIRNERTLWTATIGSLTPVLTLPNGEFGADVCARQAGFHYQGNHTNLAGWLPAAAAPPNYVQQTAQAIYNAASGGLQLRLTAANAMQRLGYNQPLGANNNQYRTEYEALRAVQVPAIGNANAKMSAMSALCQGVSAYIEFSLAGDISRFMFDPVNNRSYVTAHYKWRQGKSPFFEVLGFPAV